MKRLKHTVSILTAFLIITGIHYSCEDLLTENPEDRFVVGNFYSSERDAMAAVNAIYSRLYGGMYERQFNLLVDLIADDLKNGIGMAHSHLQDIEYCRHSSENQFVRNNWQHTYDGIARANTAINTLPDVKMDESLKSRLLGEARFLRGLFYFNALRIWGNVPLLTGIGSIDDAYAPCSPESEVCALVTEDLMFAINNLPATYNADNVGRATKGAAEILLAKVYLHRKDWQAAADRLQTVISNEAAYGYGLHENYRENWETATENGAEMVFAVQFMEPPGNGNQLMQAVAPKYSIAGGLPGLAAMWESDIPTIELYNAFDDADERKAATFHLDWVSPKNGQVYTSSIPLFYKYFEEGESKCQNSDANFHVLRYADALLMYAEALNELGSTSEAEPYINRIRERAFNDSDHNYSGLSQSELREKIRQERRLEFALEGQRFFDLTRWGIFVERMVEHGQNEAALAESLKADISANVKDIHNRFPIPQHEIDLNPDLSQNTGY